jgi:hypothetical protein
MARVKLTVHEMGKRNELMTPVATASMFEAVDATYGAEFEMSGRDDKVVVLIQNAATAAKNVTIKAGNGIQGVNDYVESVPASSTTAIVLESGRFKNVSGEDKGKVIIMGASADIKVAVIVLP